MCSTTTSITFTDILDEDESRTTLRPFAVAVSFRGSLPRHTLPIPLRVSIELPEEYAGFTSPIIKTLTSHSSDEEVDMIRLAEWNDDHSFNDDSITFLPLQTFDPFDSKCWSNLAEDIQEWLLNVVVDPYSQEWTWGRELFWMAFMAAYPTFPQGDWPSWDAKISVEGAFAQGWLDRGGAGGIENGSETEQVAMLRKDVWEQFCQTASLYYPCEVVRS